MRKSIIDYFEHTVELYPENTAAADVDGSFTYRRLRDISKRIACALAERGIYKKPVAILMNRGIKQPAAMLGALYSRNFYVVLDSESPKQRLDKIMNTLCPAAIIYSAGLESTAQELCGGTTTLNFEKIMAETSVDDSIIRNIRSRVLSNDPAYLIFTSGSTGVPKGALLTNVNVIAYIHWFIRCFGISEKTVFGSQTSLYFSMSVSDFYASMFTGAAYVIIPKEYFVFPAGLVDFLNQRNINTVYWVPSALGVAAKLDLLKYCRPESLKKILFAGEVMPVKYLNYWKKYLPDALFANLFGPTETTDICAYYIVDRDFADAEALPIGYPCDNCELFIADEYGKPVTDGENGELYVKSPFTASGYYRNAEKTKEAFVQNPFHCDFPDTVYRTGDLVRKNTRGELEYAGRRDFQIKHLGYRIEPNEVETVLCGVKGIDDAVCLYDAENDRLILAYEAADNIDSVLAASAAELLPYYMRPSEFRRFDLFPKNSNGKLDRKRIKEEILNK